MGMVAGKVISELGRGISKMMRPAPTPAAPGAAKGIIRTWSNVMIDVSNPNLLDIRIEDIAHGLSMVCRFGGHTRSFHSVAEHCIHMASMAPPHLKMQALLHDASEAYIGDMPTPIKAMLPDFQALENNLMKVIGERFGFDGLNLDPVVKSLDSAALEWEWENKVLDDTIESLSPERARFVFMRTYDDIVKHL